VQDIGQQKFLVLLLVGEAQRDQVERRPVHAAPSDQSLHVRVHIGAVA
jgi:hypothetical protein